MDHLINQGSLRRSQKQTNELTAIQLDSDVLLEIVVSLINTQQAENKNNLEKTDVNDLVRTVVNRYKRIAQANQISIKLELPSHPTIVTIYATQILRVIEGIISNAVKYSPQKSGIAIRVEDKNDSVLLMVNNQGEGISENLTRSLFNKKPVVFKAESRRFGGIGIGLPMMKEIISAHQGRIWIESGYDKGFTIIFSLPRKKTGSN